jgi:hypothetical protein
MTLHLNRDVIEKNGLTIGECLYLLNKLNTEETQEQVIKSLVEKGMIGRDYLSNGQPNGFFLTSKSIGLIETIITESDTYTEEEDRGIKTLAQTLKEMWPKGKKTPSVNWTEGVQLIILRLKQFFKRYGVYSNEDIIKASQAYINGFNGDYTYMSALKYFIWKNKVGADGVEYESQLLTTIENYDHIEESRCDWTSSLK